MTSYEYAQYVNFAGLVTPTASSSYTYKTLYPPVIEVKGGGGASSSSTQAVKAHPVSNFDCEKDNITAHFQFERPCVLSLAPLRRGRSEDGTHQVRRDKQVPLRSRALQAADPGLKAPRVSNFDCENDKQRFQLEPCFFLSLRRRYNEVKCRPGKADVTIEEISGKFVLTPFQNQHGSDVFTYSAVRRCRLTSG